MKVNIFLFVIRLILLFMITMMVLFPISAILSTYEIYNASYHHKKTKDINLKNLNAGDTFWAQIEISNDNTDLSGYVAYTSSFIYNPTHMRARKNIKTYIPDSILINIGDNRNNILLLDKNIIDFEFTSSYSGPIMGKSSHFRIPKNWLPSSTVSPNLENGNSNRIYGIIKGKPLFAKYKVESESPLVLSTKNPCTFSDPKILWEKFTNSFFWPN